MFKDNINELFWYLDQYLVTYIHVVKLSRENKFKFQVQDKIKYIFFSKNSKVLTVILMLFAFMMKSQVFLFIPKPYSVSIENIHQSLKSYQPLRSLCVHLKTYFLWCDSLYMYIIYMSSIFRWKTLWYRPALELPSRVTMKCCTCRLDMMVLIIFNPRFICKSKRTLD